MKIHSFLPASLALAIFTMSIGALSAADELFIDENFDVGNPGLPETPGGYVTDEAEVTAKYAFKEGVGVAGSRAMVLDADFVAIDGGTLAAIGFSRAQMTGNEGVSASECFIEFAAKGSKESKEFQVIIKGWRDANFSGESTGSISTILKLPETPNTFQVYRIALDDSSLQEPFDPSGKTLQILFQIYGSNWGNGPENELVIDDIKVGRKTKP
ncbi:MAG: hypothetical protein ABIT76_05625 [Chthoniobacterales bacterium]